MIDKEDIVELETVFDGRYRQIKDCDDITSSLDKRMDDFAVNQEKTNSKLAVMNAKLTATIGILAAIGGAVIPICIQKLFGG